MASSTHLTFLSIFLLLLLGLTSAVGEDRTVIPDAINIYNIQNLGRTAVVLYDNQMNRQTHWLSFCRFLYAAQQTDDLSIYFLTLLAIERNMGDRNPITGFDAVVRVSENSRLLTELVSTELVSFVRYPDQEGFMGDGQVPLMHHVDCFNLF